MPEIQISSPAGVSASSEPSQALLVFPVADQWFALPLESVRAVLAASRLQHSASDSGNLSGCVEVHGQKVSVLDMSQILVPGANRASAQQIILLRSGAAWAGLTTAGTSETINISALQMAGTSCPENTPRWASSVCRVDGRSITVLDPDRFVADLCPTS